MICGGARNVINLRPRGGFDPNDDTQIDLTAIRSFARAINLLIPSLQDYQDFYEQPLWQLSKEIEIRVSAIEKRIFGKATVQP
jgi:hypothetical protein